MKEEKLNNTKETYKKPYEDLRGQVFGDWIPLEYIGGGKWLCKCHHCGVERKLAKNELKKGKRRCKCSYKREFRGRDLTGQVFGRLRVIEYVGKDNRSKSMWKCVCECSNVVIVRCDSLTMHHTTSCGCACDQEKRDRHKSLIGVKNGFLTGIERLPNRGETVMYRFKCDCGGLLDTDAMGVVHGRTISCGCLKSKGERKVAHILRDNNIVFFKQKTFDDCKRYKGCNFRFDFYLPNENYIIEYDGERHFNRYKDPELIKKRFEPIRERDEMKNEYCRENGIPFIRIPYTHYRDICLEDLQLETTKFRVV